MNIIREDNRIIRLHEIENRRNSNMSFNIYIWGCSQTAKMITQFCQKHSQLFIEAYIIDDAYFQENCFEGKEVIKASRWKEIVQAGDVVIFGFTNSDRAKELIAELPKGVEGIYFYFPYSANAFGGYLTYSEYDEHREKYEKTFQLLKDDYSKQIMEAFLNSCISGQVETLEQLRTDGQYFNELTSGCREGGFIDCGAYVGDTLEDALEFYSNRIKKIISFEPDNINITQYNERIKKLNLDNDIVQLIPKGSWSDSTSLHFSSSGSSSSISETGDIKIDVDSIDNVLEGNVIEISYIKMDVEGCEAESLIGAQKTIQKYHPILAVCVYHKSEDLYVIPELIQNLSGGNGYDFYLRYHGTDLRELVLYAIPKDLEI